MNGVEVTPWLAPSLPGHAVAARHGRRDYLLRRCLLASDAVAIMAAYLLVFSLNDTLSVERYAVWALLTLPFWLVITTAYGLYDRDTKRISHGTVDDIPWLAHAVLVGCLLTWGFFHVAPVREMHSAELLLFAAVALVNLLALRSLARRGAFVRLGPERVLIIGGGPVAALLLRKMRAHREYHLEPVGIVTAGPESVDAAVDLPVVGQLAGLDVAGVALHHRIERVVIAQGEVEEDASLAVVRACKPLAIKVSVLPPLFGAMGPSVEVDDVEGVTVLGINPPVLGRSSMMLKRALDLIGSTVLLLGLAPIFAVIALAIRLDSRGPVLFRQTRVGKGDRRFTLLKFRTMVADAEALRGGLLAESEDPNWLKIDRDPRITRVGRVLRQTSLDELAQLWNVLRGHMSLVGPRPLIEPEDDRVDGWARSRLDLTPGITGLWQVLGRTNIPFEEMVKLDYLYVTNWSLWNDMRLTLRTLPVMVGRRGVN